MGAEGNERREKRQATSLFADKGFGDEAMMEIEPNILFIVGSGGFLFVCF